MAKKKQGPLTGIKVLDLSRILAGPFCTMNLGDMGAEIIKIEQPGKGDDTRAWGPPFAGSEAAYFLGINRNKKSVTLNLKSEEGIDILKRLLKEADVFSLVTVSITYKDGKIINQQYLVEELEHDPSEGQDWNWEDYE